MAHIPKNNKLPALSGNFIANSRSDWLVARNDKTEFKSKVGESVTLAVDVHLPITIPSRNFKWEKRRERDGLMAKKFE